MQWVQPAEDPTADDQRKQTDEKVRESPTQPVCQQSTEQAAKYGAPERETMVRALDFGSALGRAAGRV